MTLRPLTEHHLEFLWLIGGCTGSSEYTLVKLPHYWISHVAAHFLRFHIYILETTGAFYCIFVGDLTSWSRLHSSIGFLTCTRKMKMNCSVVSAIMQFSVVFFLVLQSSRWGKSTWLRYVACLLDVEWLLVFCVSSSRCHVGWFAVCAHMIVAFPGHTH